MENILNIGGDKPGVADAVQKAIEKDRPHFSYKHAIGGETAMMRISLNMMRAGKPNDYIDLLGEDESASGGAERPIPGSFSAEERDFIKRILDAAEAEMLRRQRQQAVVADKPLIERIPALKNLDPEDSKNQGPIAALVDLFSPIFSQSVVAEARSNAKENVVMAAAAVLAYKGRHGSYPSKLEQALPQEPMDPLTGKPLNYRIEKSGFV